MNYRELGALAATNKHICSLFALTLAGSSKQHARDAFIGYEMAHDDPDELKEISAALETVLPFIGLPDLYIVDGPGKRRVRCKSLYEVQQATKLDYDVIIKSVTLRCEVSGGSIIWSVSPLQSVL